MAGFTLKGLLWKETLQVNLVRACVAGVIWMVLFIGISISSSNQNSEMPLWVALSMPLLLPFGYFLFYLPVGLVAGWLSGLGVPFVGLLSIGVAILIMPADPFVYFLHRVNPRWVPIDSYRFFEPVLSIWVYDHTHMAH